MKEVELSIKAPLEVSIDAPIDAFIREGVRDLLKIIFVIGIGAVLFYLHQSIYFRGHIHSEAENISIETLISKIERGSQYDYTVSRRCTYFVVDKKTKKYIDISLYENHTKEGCYGDPNTNLKIDSFRVLQADHQVYWFDKFTSSMLPFEAAFSKVNDHQNCIQYSDALSERAILQNPYISSITANAQTYFYSAPSEKCVIRNKLITYGAKITVYNDTGEWAKIKYSNPNTKVDYSVWIKSKNFTNNKTDKPAF